MPSEFVVLVEIPGSFDFKAISKNLSYVELSWKCYKLARSSAHFVLNFIEYIVFCYHSGRTVGQVYLPLDPTSQNY